MKTSLTPAQIAQYQTDGFIHIPGFLSPEEVTDLKTAVIETVQSMGKKKLAGDNWEEDESYYSKVFTQKLNLWKISDTIKRYMLSPALGEMATRLADADGIRVWHDQALIKEPFGNATAWHLDNPYWSFYSKNSLSIWIALEDATPFNGCMCFIPGTHRLATYDNAPIGQNMGDLFKIYPEMAKIDPVPVPMKAGDCSFHNGLVAHGAGANMTRGRRIAMTCAYMPEGSRFNGQKNILPQDYFQSLKKDDLLQNNAQNPLLFKK